VLRSRCCLYEQAITHPVLPFYMTLQSLRLCVSKSVQTFSRNSATFRRSHRRCSTLLCAVSGGLCAAVLCPRPVICPCRACSLKTWNWVDCLHRCDTLTKWCIKQEHDTKCTVNSGACTGFKFVYLLVLKTT